jgi:hypothetical protein
MKDEPDLMVLIYPDDHLPDDVIDILTDNHALGVEVCSYSQWVAHDIDYSCGHICVREDGTWMSSKGQIAIDAIRGYVKAMITARMPR